ncbi:MAG: hypothetical protein KatS3mg125_0253 [Lysobacterales bacterium]|jgi:hypothetical protein|nr:MAG: hypothetical protein KatS3mg125_0253 [Xanthomonadales bacterium]
MLRHPSLLISLLLAVSGPALGQSLDESVRRVERETGGRILSAETLRAGDREIHRIKVLTPDGRVRVIQQEGGLRGAYPRESWPLESSPARRERPRAEAEEREEDERPSRRGRGGWEN